MTMDLLPAPDLKVTDGAALDSLLDRLVAVKPGHHRVVSCYLRLTPEERARRRYLTSLKSRIQTVREDAVANDLSRILAYVASARALPAGGGLAIFACEALDLFEVAALPRVHRTRVMVDDTPRLVELVAARRELGAIITAVIDRSHARFFLVRPGSATELEGLVQASRRGGKFHSDRADAPGWGEHDYHNRIREEQHRHCAAVAQHLEALTRDRPARGIVLAGPRKEVAALTPFLPRELIRHLLGTAPLNPTAVTGAEVQRVALAAASEHDREEELTLVSSLAASIGAGWAVEGPRETLQALARGQLRTLLIRADLEGAGFRCSATGRLALTRTDCRGEGEPTPVQDLADEVVEEAIRQGIEVILVHDSAAAEAIEGLAGILRFR